jgi:hypothetical protein
LSTIRASHPRIWFNTDNLAAARANWDDAAYSAIRGKYEGGTDAIDLALEGLMTENASKCSQAANVVGSSFNREGTPSLGHIDPISLVFDWCYNYISSAQKTDLITRSLSLRSQHKTRVNEFFRWHGCYLQSMYAYIAHVLALEGEAGVSSELQLGQNVLQNFQEIGDEASGDGGYRDYWFQGTTQLLPIIMWSYATDLDFGALSGYAQYLAKWVAYKMAPSTNGFIRGMGDDAAFSDAFLKDEQDAGGFYMLAEHFNDPVAQWLGNFHVNDFGQTYHWWQSTGPMFTSLIFYDPDRVAQTPSQAGYGLSARFNSSGMVTSRSSWGTGGDVVNSWFYNGPHTEHSTRGQNSFQIWRGDDPLIMRGGNYLGSPSVYKSGFHEQTISHNTLIFNPTGSGDPDKDGDQGTGGLNDDETLEHYPAHQRVGSWGEQCKYRGEISYYDSTDEYTIATGKLSDDLISGTYCYDDNYVNSYDRDFVHLRPDIFLIRDRFDTTNIEKIRSLIYSRAKPVYSGSTSLVQGSESAGIIELYDDNFQLQNGSSEADVQVLWPQTGAQCLLVGGEGYESYTSETQYDPYTDCQSWLKTHWELPLRAALITGQWRTEIEVTPAQAEGNLITAIYVSGTDPGSIPTYEVTKDGTDIIVAVTDTSSKLVTITFPADGAPTIDYNPIAIGDVSHAHTADNLALVPHTVAIIPDSICTHVADGIVVNFIPDTIIGMGEHPTHAHTADSLVLINHVVLVVADATSTHTAESPSLVGPIAGEDISGFERQSIETVLLLTK